MNQANLSGYVGQEPQVTHFPNGDRVATFSIAISKKWKDRDTGERKIRTDWHKIRVYGSADGGPAETVVRFVSKGSRIRVTGELNNYESVNNKGDKVLYTYIDVRRSIDLELLDPPRDMAPQDDGSHAIGYLDVSGKDEGPGLFGTTGDEIDDDAYQTHTDDGFSIADDDALGEINS